MRSLFTTDIPGAVPRNLYYDKQLYLKKHQEEIERFGPKNPEHKRVIEWHRPRDKITDPIDKNSSVIKPHSIYYQENSPDRLSRSVVIQNHDSLDVTGKVTEGISLKNNSSSVFSTAGKKSLGDSFSRDVSENPYFPHRYANKCQKNESKLTGKRDWNYNDVERYKLPSAEEHYFPKWG